MPSPDLLAQARDIEPEIVGLRRAIHAEPELGLHTPLTRDKVRAALAGLPLEWREGPSTTGMVATLKGQAGEGRRVLLRGDMDALPMPEETGLAFSSRFEGAMHACGHDAHTAMLAGAARLLCERRASLAGEVQFMFQPGEEGWHGARFMLDDGLIDPLPDAAFALHVMPNARHGVIGGRAGPLLAAADQLEIVVEGAGGHASMPHQTRDPVPVAAEIVMALQSLVTRRFNAHDPVVVTIASLSAGSAHNVIADRAVMKGTMRTLSPAHRAELRDAVQLLAAGIAGAHGLTATVTIIEGFPVTICDARAVDFGEAVTRDLLGADRFQRLADPIMGAEDFAYVLERVPGAMFFLGVAPEGDNWAQCCGIHSTRMMVDEGTLPVGAALLAALGERFLAGGFGA
ncbi:M20 family metallopeptidase [Novosphingobium sp. TH158]|uniref:M20 metallopeptidase family protein n=1 Tax=Novosphingobium sp. TH158 TaxID=2067455 RepID=UPI000C7D74D4|nr:M20 family metallopeptidase [Novosphingobium sp. TH158]PLK27087.1 amidohydrolase [Novosphingobium sp. TH158]